METVVVVDFVAVGVVYIVPVVIGVVGIGVVVVTTSADTIILCVVPLIT